MSAKDRDSDANARTLYRLVSGVTSPGAMQSLPMPVPAPVRVDETSGDLFLTEQLDREHRDRYEFAVVAVDRLNQSLNDTAKVLVVRTTPTTGFRLYTFRSKLTICSQLS